MNEVKYSPDKFDSSVDYNTVLDNFEGPLDFLLYLINREEIEIKDVFVSKVTDQFLDYVKAMPKLDMDKASAYLALAATIVSIKAKSLVPSVDDEEEYAEEDDSDEQNLIRALEEYNLIKQEAEKLKELETVGYFFKKPDKSVGETKIVYRDFNLEGLLKAFTAVMLLKHQYVKVKQNGIFGDIDITLNPDRAEDEEFGEIDEYN